MSDLQEGLIRARAAYAANPSHAPFGTIPRDGRCLVLACDTAGCYVEEALAAVVGLAPDTTGFRVPLIKWNAEATTDEVLAAFDRAIQAAVPANDLDEIADRLTDLAEVIGGYYGNLVEVGFDEDQAFELTGLYYHLALTGQLAAS